MKWLILLLLPFLLSAYEPFFIFIDAPPKWVLSDPSRYEKGVKIALVASERAIFSPSITLAVEYIGKASFESYKKALKKIYRQDRFQELGTFNSSAAQCFLFQIDRKSNWGEIRILQSITFYEDYALIQTGACLKKDFLNNHELFLKTFKSLQVTPNLMASCQDSILPKKIKEITTSFKKLCATSKESKGFLFNSSFFQENQWKPFVNYIEKKLKSEGICWQFLALKYVQEVLLMENEQ